MPLTITQSIPVILPGRTFEILAVADTGNFCHVYCSAAPSDSEIGALLAASTGKLVPLGSAYSSEPIPLTFDKPGAYTLQITEVQKGQSATFRGGYAESPAGHTDESDAISVDPYTVYVAQKCTADIALGQERASLVLWVYGSDIVRTNFEQHGEESPRLEPTTDRMKIAAESTAVISALSALVCPVSTAIGNIQTTIDNVMTKFALHRATGAIHSSADSSNTIATSYFNSTSPESWRRTIAEASNKIRRHITNDFDGTGPGSATGSPNPAIFHASVGWQSLPISNGASDALGAAIAAADCWSAYESHRATGSPVHSSADFTNSCSALPPLLNLFRLIIEVVRASAPTAPVTDNPGAVALVSGVGFVKS